ncbi:MAG: hypothetical protein M1813_009191 [Trichoglossum hirsutum]|nr:MAG: hypothetical protein M1813_009191 [Trichoglossum hirsutum]
MYDTPRRAIAYVLAQEWSLSEEVMTALLELKQSTMPRSVYRLPSLDVKPFTKSIRMSWALNAPKYSGFLETITWRPHEKPPEFEYVNIFLLPTTYQADHISSLRRRSKSRRIIILFKTKDSLARFLRIGLSEIRTSQNARYSVLSKFSLVVFTVYRQMIQDILDFLQKCSDQLDTLFFTGRHSPTEAKIHYLLHLDDHLVKSVAELNIACDELKKWIKPPPPPWVRKVRAELLMDLQYLESEFVKLRGRIKELREIIKELSDWAQMMRTVIITILVAIYVPLSYVAVSTFYLISKLRPFTNYK